VKLPDKIPRLLIVHDAGLMMKADPGDANAVRAQLGELAV